MMAMSTANTVENLREVLPDDIERIQAVASSWLVGRLKLQHLEVCSSVH